MTRKGGGRFGKYGEVKRKARLRRARLAGSHSLKRGTVLPKSKRRERGIPKTEIETESSQKQSAEG